MRKCSVNVDKLHKRPPLGTRWAGKEGWPEWTEKQTAMSILCSQARMKSVCGWEPENPGWLRGDWPSAHKLFWAWPLPPVQGRGRTQRRPLKWPDDVAHAGSDATGRSLPPSPQVPTHDDLERNKGRRWHQAWLPKLKEQNGSSHSCWHLGGLAVWQERRTGHKTKQSRLHYGYLWLTDTDLQCMLRKPSIIIANVLEQEQFCYCALLVCHCKMTLMSVGLPHTTSTGLQNADLEAINVSQ